MRDLYGRLRNQNFQLVAVNYGDSVKQIKDYAKQGKFTFPIVRDNTAGTDVAKLYGVQAYPTNYVIDANGKIVARFVGFDEQGIKSALKKLGLKP